jgi:glycine/D-amino acid oxidase-like deaminating enzyme
VVLATDAYQDLMPVLARRVRIICNYVLVTEPLNETQADRLCWPSREAFVHNRAMDVFARPTWDGRILLGGGYASPTYRTEGGHGGGTPARAQRWTTMTFRQFFPMLPDLAVGYFYGGAVAATADRVPHVGRLSPRACYAYGYSGNGIVVSRAAAEAVRDLVLERATASREPLFVSGREPRFSQRVAPLPAPC